MWCLQQIIKQQESRFIPVLPLRCLAGHEGDLREGVMFHSSYLSIKCCESRLSPSSCTYNISSGFSPALVFSALCLPTSGYPGLVNGDNVGRGGESVVLFFHALDHMCCVWAVDFGAVLLLGILLFQR